MSKKLGRMIHPGMGVYFSVMGCFCLAAVLMSQYVLAAVEAVVTLLLFTSYMILRRIRHKDILRYIQTASNTLESVSQGETPLPTVIARLGDGGIIWTNDSFIQLR